MPRPRVYVETTIPSFYYDTRSALEIVERRKATREWWSGATATFDLITSSVVYQELSRGASERVGVRLALLEGLEMMLINSRVVEIMQTYVQQKLMPASPRADAFHLALASYNACDFLVTWNCRHLANANKVGHIRRVNTQLGLSIPSLVTPLDLLRRRI